MQIPNIKHLYKQIGMYITAVGMVVSMTLTYRMWSIQDRRACRQEGHLWEFSQQRGLSCSRCHWCGGP